MYTHKCILQMSFLWTKGIFILRYDFCSKVSILFIYLFIFSCTYVNIADFYELIFVPWNRDFAFTNILGHVPAFTVTMGTMCHVIF